MKTLILLILLIKYKVRNGAILMKKKLALLSLATIAMITLSSCNYFMQIGGSDGGIIFFPGYNSFHHAPSIIDVSTPPAGDLTANKSPLTYKDYIENNVYPLSATPSTGEVKFLIIPVWFNDSATYINESKKENVRQDIEKVYFGSDEETGWKSVKTYYEQESLGALQISGTVSEWYECTSSVSYYAHDPTVDNHGVPKTSALVKDATDWYFSNHSSARRRDYDYDGDGYLDAVMLIYAAPDLQASGHDENSNYDNLWAYCFWIQETSHKNTASPGVNAFFWASYDFMYSRALATTRTGKNYGSGDTKYCNLDAHTYIHEMGHMFGLEDYYDYSKNKYQPAGGFSMQDHNVGSHDPFSSFALGWGKAYMPTESTDIDLKPFTTSGEMIVLKPTYANTPFDEYLLLEYYTPDGLNAFDIAHPYMKTNNKDYPTATEYSGIRVWHVDARLLYTNNPNSPNAYSASRVTNNPRISSYRVTMMMSNTYLDDEFSALGYCCELVNEHDSDTYSYADCNLLQLIHQRGVTDYKSKKFFTTDSLFRNNDTFSMETYGKQFVNEGKLNSDIDLGFTFTVNGCNNGYASISITKL